MDNILTDDGIETMIHKAKECGYITARQLGEDANDIVSTVIRRTTKSKLLAYGLIEKSDKENGLYYLTLKARHFKTFKREDKFVSWVYWRAKYWWVISLVSFIAGLIPTLIKYIA